MDKLKFDSFSSFASSVQTQVQENKKGAAIVAGASAAGLGALYLARRAATAVPKSGAYGFGTLPSDAYDAAIVGAGPSGSVCGFYMAKSGAKVALLDKETFPRDKYCGDAVCTPAIRILEDMGVLAELKANNEAHFADAGGFVSPSGISYIGASKEKLGQAACCAVKRINLDVRIARAAQRKGADLKEGFEVTAATFDKASNAELAPHRLSDTLAFMFESRHVFRPTAQALQAGNLQPDYDSVWQGFEAAGTVPQPKG